MDHTTENTKHTIVFELNYTDIYCSSLAICYRIKELLSKPITPEIFDELAMLTMTNIKFMPIVMEKVLQESQEPITIQSLLPETC